MDKLEFAEVASKILVTKQSNVNGSISLNVVEPRFKCGICVAGVPNPNFLQKKRDLIDTYNKVVDAVARMVDYVGQTSSFYVTSTSEVEQHVVVPVHKPGTKNVVYIRTKRGYNNHGSKKGISTSRKGENTHMKNRKVTLTLITLPSGFALTLQVTSASKDATAWTRFCDPDLSKAEYDNITWTKDVNSANKDAVEAVDAMIQIEEDYAAGKLEKKDAIEQLKSKYEDWVIAHLITNPKFVERRMPGLNCDEDLMAAYRLEEIDEQPESAEPAEPADQPESAE